MTRRCPRCNKHIELIPAPDEETARRNGPHLFAPHEVYDDYVEKSYPCSGSNQSPKTLELEG